MKNLIEGSFELRKRFHILAGIFVVIGTIVVNIMTFIEIKVFTGTLHSKFAIVTSLIGVFVLVEGMYILPFYKKKEENRKIINILCSIHKVTG